MGNRVCEQYHRDAAVYAHQICVSVYSQQQQLITLTTTPVQPLPPVHFMELEYHFSSIKMRIAVDSIAESIIS